MIRPDCGAYSIVIALDLLLICAHLVSVVDCFYRHLLNDQILIDICRLFDATLCS
jgi:hypothetical protein